MPRPTAVAAFVLSGLLLLGLGIVQSAWWPLMGGTGALAAAAWLATEDA